MLRPRRVHSDLALFSHDFRICVPKTDDAENGEDGVVGSRPGTSSPRSPRKKRKGNKKRPKKGGKSGGKGKKKTQRQPPVAKRKGSRAKAPESAQAADERSRPNSRCVAAFRRCRLSTCFGVALLILFVVRAAVLLAMVWNGGITGNGEPWGMHRGVRVPRSRHKARRASLLFGI